MKRNKNTFTNFIKTGTAFGAFFVLLGGALYSVIWYPMKHPEAYQEIQKVTRKGINQEDIQPGNMKVWRDPFDRESKQKKILTES